MMRMSQLWSPFALFYQGRRDMVGQAMVATGLTLLVGNLLQSSLVFSSAWVVVLILAVFVLGILNRTAGYLAAVAAVIWPLWSLSPYLATLFLAIAILGREPLVANLEWTILIVGAPILAPLGLTAVAPLAAGLFLGAPAGFWVGLLTALWLKVTGGMAGVPPDMLSLHQHSILLSDVGSRFFGADSLQTLKLIVAPFAGHSTFLLLDLLQVLLWGLAGYVVGWLRSQAWAEREPWISLVPGLMIGTLTLWGSLFLVPIWLELAAPALLWSDPIMNLGLAISLVGVAGLYTMRYLLLKPVPRVRWRPAAHAHWPEPASSVPMSSTSQPSSRRSASSQRSATPADESAAGDVIMLELD